MKTLYLRMTLWLGILCVGYGFFCPWGVRPHFYPFMNTYYDLQTEAVLDRRLDLNIPVDRDFFETSDPISFAAYHAYIDDAQGVHDLSYYKGKLFSYFGMAPVFTLYLPYRLLSGGEPLPDHAVVLFFCCGALVWTAMLMTYLKARYFPKVPEWMLLFGVGVMAFGNISPFLIWSSRHYEVALSAGVFFMTGALYFLSRALSQTVTRGRDLCWAGLLFGLAVGSRPSFLSAGPGLIVLTLAVLWGLDRSDRRQKFVRSSALLVPITVLAGLWCLINYLRFGDPFELGLTYQIGWNNRAGGGNFLDYSRFFNNLRVFLFQPLESRPSFPYFSYQVLRENNCTEPMAGLFLCAPFAGMFFLAPLILWASARKARGILRDAGVSLGGAAAVYFGILLIQNSFRFFNQVPGPMQMDWLSGSGPEKAVYWSVFFVIFFSIVGREAIKRSFEAGSRGAFRALAVLSMPLWVSLPVLVLFGGLAGRTLRYLADLAPFMLLASFSMWCYADTKYSSALIVRSTMRIFGIILGLMTVIIGATLGFQGF